MEKWRAHKRYFAIRFFCDNNIKWDIFEKEACISKTSKTTNEQDKIIINNKALKIW